MNIQTGSVSQTQLTFANKAIADETWTLSRGQSPLLVAVSDKSFIYSDSSDVPKLYYSIDGNGLMDNYTLSDIPLFSSNNMNPNWSSSPLTLSNLVSALVTIAALFVALFLFWAQEKFLRQRERTWIDDSDIPGSKVAEEMDEESFRVYQREEQERMQRHVQEQISLGRPPEQNPFAPYADITVSPQFETSYTGTAVTTSREALTEAHSEPLRLEGLRFSSHPRPNVVTTIPDDDEDSNYTGTRLP